MTRQTGRFDERAVGVAAVENLDGVSDVRDAVVLRYFLQHDGRAMRLPVAVETVAVDLVHDVCLIAIVESRGVDGSALVDRTGEGLVRGQVGPSRVGARGGADAVFF